ncbi:hypothetical protein TK50_04790 [Micromonospora haikouensis]|uniref:Uncharacterized protein n=1 Tax=Micromonospora haikouensis TaxID=686309 RepID=A0A0D0X1S1_9ACTN|nr:hypothetical protein TK50_04790 [Micromonospora haikouensis]
MPDQGDRQGAGALLRLADPDDDVGRGLVPQVADLQMDDLPLDPQRDSCPGCGDREVRAPLRRLGGAGGDSHPGDEEQRGGDSSR